MRAYDVSQLILRLALAVVIWPHGAQKALGLFGGPGIAGTIQGLSGRLAVPEFAAYLVIAVEFIGPVLLVLGVLTRATALAIGVDMAFAAIFVHLPNGFFLNFAGTQKGEGIEFFIPLVGISLALLIGGPGRFALLRKT